MPKSSRDALKAKGKTDIYLFDPQDVVLVEDESSAIYDERVHLPIDEAMVANMMYAPDGETSQGVLEACSGRRNPETGKTEIVDGRQRTKNAREANRRLKKEGRPLIRLPVWIRRGNDSRHMAALISTNEHRKDDTPMGRAQKVQRYIHRGHDEAEIAVLLGISKSSVKDLLALLDAPAAVRNAVDAGKITTSAGYKLARMDPPEAKKKLGELLELAPRTPGKKRSPNAARAREVLGITQPPSTEPKSTSSRSTEDRVAEAIATWIENTWSADDSENNWDGAPSAIPARIRSGDWRKSLEKATG
jgi:ParB family transcriptional regulator, chromosome partitioning protein